jgi:hypothetical protein
MRSRAPACAPGTLARLNVRVDARSPQYTPPTAMPARALTSRSPTNSRSGTQLARRTVTPWMKIASMTLERDPKQNAAARATVS